jgi:hypothetical protein
MKFITNVLFMIMAIASTAYSSEKEVCKINSLVEKVITPQNNCVSFSVSSGTGCAWMCSYCANSLGTNNYYFTDGVCKYESGGCVGNPQVGVVYTCCSA